MISIQPVLESFYKTSETPFQMVSGGPVPQKDYLMNEDIVAHIGKVQNSQALKAVKDQGVTDDDIRGVILFSLQLVNSPIDLKGALLVEPAINYLIRSILHEEKSARGEGAGIAIESIISTWFTNLKKTPAEAKKFYRQLPHYESAPLLAFHVESLKSCKLPDETYPFYETYAYEFHKRLRFHERTNLPKDTRNACVRTVRYFFLFCSAETKSRRNLTPDTIPISVVKDFKSGYTKYRMERKKSDAIEETADVYWERLRKIWHKMPILPRSRFRKGYARPSDNPDDLTSPDESPGENPPGFNKSDYEIEDDLDDEDEWGRFEPPPATGWDFGYASEQEQKTTTDKDPEIHDYKWHDLIHLRNYHYYWENKYLGLFHYSALYHAMQTIWDKEPVGLHRILATYFNFLIHTGMGSHVMLDLRGPKCEKVRDDEPQLITIKDRYYIAHPPVVKLQTALAQGRCLPTADKIHIPVPGKLAALLKALPETVLKSDYVFSFTDKSNRISRLKPDIIFAFLNDVNKSFERYALKITLPRIASSFQPLYHNRYGLDPIIACHVSGKDRQKLFSSQMHYIHVKHNRLVREYLTVFNDVDFSIRENLNRCLEKRLIKSDRKILTNKREAPVIFEGDVIGGYGSPYIPQGDYVLNMIGALKKALADETDMVLRHNLFVMYAYLGLQFSIALRPRNNPHLPWKRINTMSGTILIKDKQSERYREERLLPLPMIMRTLLGSLQSGFKTVEDHILRNFIFSDQCHKADSVFFFIDDEGRLGPMTIKGIRERLAKIGIDYSLPPNMPRHYLRTYLFDAKISCDLADTWLGHQHVGRETLGIISSVVFRDAVCVCLPHIETMMKEIGFTSVPYLPDTNA